MCPAVLATRASATRVATSETTMAKACMLSGLLRRGTAASAYAATLQATGR
jgi:hypothetical protein